jgi:dihydrofolate reductase
MTKLLYSSMVSLDGYFEDAEGKFDWATPDEEVHAFANERMRPIGTHLYGRRLYEAMTYWEQPPPAEEPPAMHEFAALWQAADKIVYSRTLEAVATARTRLERTFDPEAVRQLKARAELDLVIGGGELARAAFAAGLIDEVQLYVSPILVGGGKRALPDGVRLELALVEERRFSGGTVFLRYGRR